MRPFLFLALLAGFAAAPNFTSADESSPPVKVLSFNIRYGTAKDGDDHWDRRKEFVADVVKDTAPDLMGTQETLKFQRDYLLEHAPGYEQLSIGRDSGDDSGEMTPVFWKKDRFEKLAGGHFWLSETPEKAGSKSWDSSLPRIASWVKLKDAKAASAKPILFINTHFDHKGETARLEAAKLIRAKIAELGSDCSVIVTGDFNAGEASPPYAAFFGPSGEQAAAVVDSFRVAHPERTAEEGTFNGFKAGTNTGARIDWIGVSRDWTVVSAVINRVVRDGRTPSDHYPIAVELTR